MEKINKFQIYYKPTNDTNIVSFTLSISRINTIDNTYKLKLIKEVKNDYKIDTYKIKEFHLNVDTIIEKLNIIDFNKKYDNYIEKEDVYCIKLDNNKIMTSNKNQIQYILDLFDFESLYNINICQYDKIKDIYEFVKLNNLFLSKVLKIKDDKQFMSIYDYYLNKNPYKIFENLNELNKLKL